MCIEELQAPSRDPMCPNPTSSRVAVCATINSVLANKGDILLWQLASVQTSICQYMMLEHIFYGISVLLQLDYVMLWTNEQQA